MARAGIHFPKERRDDLESYRKGTLVGFVIVYVRARTVWLDCFRDFNCNQPINASPRFWTYTHNRQGHKQTRCKVTKFAMLGLFPLFENVKF